MAENRVIGRDNTVPWHLPADLKHYQSLTTGHVVIMGRKTFESIGRPLPRRRTIILTRNPTFRQEGAETAASLQEALQRVETEEEVFVAGGAEVYEEAMDHADQVYLTVVEAEIEGDTFFPAMDRKQWKLVEDGPHHPVDDRHAFPFTFQRHERRR
jgi:dihydrofolate reductase